MFFNLFFDSSALSKKSKKIQEIRREFNIGLRKAKLQTFPIKLSMMFFIFKFESSPMLHHGLLDNSIYQRRYLKVRGYTFLVMLMLKS